MEPIIRNYRDHFTPGGGGARLVNLGDNPPTTTLSYSPTSRRGKPAATTFTHGSMRYSSSRDLGPWCATA